jgi:hypothetical protein
MMGTNDTEPSGEHRFESNLRRLVDTILAAHVVPLLSTIPPRGDSATMNAVVPEMNAVIRAIAQARQVPYMDLWQTVVGLPDQGLVSDGVHLSVYVSGGAHGCWLTPPALQEGMNQRNKVTLEALDRVRRFILEDETPEVAQARAGRGTCDDPRRIDALPFVDDGDTTAGVSVVPQYACGAQDEGGPEIVYRIEVAQAETRARVFTDEGVDLDLHWLDGPSAAQCTARADRTLDIQAQPGVHYLAVDSFVSSGKALSGGYRLTLHRIP